MSKIIGIDLGTTKSVVSVMENGKPVVIPNKYGKQTTPSVVAFLENKKILVGEDALRQATLNPQNTVIGIKRLMGLPYSQIEDNLHHFPFQLVRGKNYSTISVKINKCQYSLQEISAIILKYMKSIAENYLCTRISEAVITVPSYFDDDQRVATKQAAEIAGLKVKRLINEATATALAYGLNQNQIGNSIVVLDLGGGTFDISILELDDVLEIKSTKGDTKLGGRDFDKKIVDWLVNEFLKDEGIDLRKDPMALQRLTEAAEKAKIELSASTKTNINLPYIICTNGVYKHLVKDLSISKFEELCQDLIETIVNISKKAFKEVGLSLNDVNTVILAGSASAMPCYKNALKRLFVNKVLVKKNPTLTIAKGAAIQAGILSGEINKLLLIDLTPFPLGVETSGGVMTKLIEANTTIPVTKTETFTTAADNQPSVEIHVLQGVGSMVRDNKTIGRFLLDGILPATRGEPKIEVTFDIDANGILNVSAKDKAFGKRQSIRIEGYSGLGDSEIQEIKTKVNETLERYEKIKIAENIIGSFEKRKDIILNEEKPEIKNYLKKIKTAISSQNFAEIEDMINLIDISLGELCLQFNHFEFYKVYIDIFTDRKFFVEIKEKYDKLSDDFFWEQCKAQNTIKLVSEYLREYPYGKYSDDAKKLLEKKETTYWQTCFKSNKLKDYIDYSIVYPNGQFIEKAEEEINWKECKAENNISSFETYIKKYPNGKYVVFAKEEIDWIKCKKENKTKNYQDYLKKYPNGKNVQQAHSIIANDIYFWKTYVKDGILSTYKKYLKTYPNGKYSDNARLQISRNEEERFWINTTQKNTIRSYKKYLRKYPYGEYTDEANEMILWLKALRRNNIRSYKKYLESYPNGKYVKQAKEKI